MKLFLSAQIRGLRRWCRLAGLAAFLTARAVQGQTGVFFENWETSTNGQPPYGGWILDAGQWGEISNAGLGGGKCYLVPSDGSSRIRHLVNLSNCEDIVLQGWLYDSGGDLNKTLLGLNDEANSLAYPLIRVGVGFLGKSRNYIIAFTDHLQAKGNIIVDTEMPFEKGWHFVRLDIMHDRSVTYRIWNADQTVEKTGNFGWVFDKNKFRYVIIGSIFPTPGAVGWDDIKVGSLKEIGPPPSLPKSGTETVRPKEEVKASDDGLQLLLQFEDESATGVSDSSGNNRSAVLRDGARIANVEGRGRCLELDGKTAYLELPPGFADFTQGMTVAFWARPTNEGTWARLLDLGNGYRKDNISIERQADTANLVVQVFLGEGAGATSAQVIATNAVEPMQWQHIAVVMDRSGRVKIFKNGAVITTSGCLVPKAIKRTSNLVGRSNAGSGNYAGQIDDLRIYTRALRDEEIARLARPR